MTNLPYREIAGLPEIRVVDLVALPREQRAELLPSLVAVHSTFFPEFPHVAAEWQAWHEGAPWPVPDVVGHLFLVFYGDEPVGEMIIDTHLRRGVDLVHFIAVRPPVRHLMPEHALRCWIRFFYEVGLADCQSAGVPYLGIVGEVPQRMVGLYQEYGFDQVGIDYGEPRHGMHWADHGPPEFFSNALIVFQNPDEPRPGGEAALAAVGAFSLDHYRVPAEHPFVARMLEGAAAQRELPADITAAARATVAADPWKF